MHLHSFLVILQDILKYMLSKKERLSRAEFDTVFARGKRIHSPSIQLICSPSATFHGSVVVGKKVYKKAVDRNKLRRRLYAVLYQFSKTTLEPMTYIVVTKPASSGASRTVLAQELHASLKMSLKK